MFDSETTRLIQDAAPLEGLDLDRLPQFLTEAYAQVIAARVGAAGADDESQEERSRILLQLRRLAETYEGLTIFLPYEDKHRSSCAFVAGSAHYTLALTRRFALGTAISQVPPPSLTMHSVAPELAACLLFLIGGHQADAAETAKSFVRNEEVASTSRLLDGIEALASGSGLRIEQIASSSTSPSTPAELDYLEAAAEALWIRLTRAVQMLAARLLGQQADDPIATIDRVIDVIHGAQQSVSIGGTSAQFRLPLEGPYHLARLLRATAESLLRTAVVNTPPPEGTSASDWSRTITHFAKQRPLLWRNHLAALEAGFLDSGRSFVITFPTGAGKTTVSQLRIAAEVLRGHDVVYLAPTRALVDQVTAELSQALEPIALNIVRGRFVEDYGERAAGRVFVQTPEQCLAYLAFEETAHSSIGLLIVDEGHQLSGDHASDGELALPGRRSLDAMWAVLSLLQRSAGCDIILISAMIRNGAELADWLCSVTNRPAVLLDLPWKPTRQVRGIVAYESSEVLKLHKLLASRRKARGWTRNPRTADRVGIASKPVGLFCHTQVWDTASTFAKFDLLPTDVPLGVNKWWDLTANRNEVGGRLLAAMATAGMRPMVFTQRIGWTMNIARVGAEDLSHSGAEPIPLTEYEESLFVAAEEELGDVSFVQRPVEGLIGLHHGLLLEPERVGVESAFRREDGLVALVATPTVAQGINLPAEAVIIAGDDRWQGDLDDGGAEVLAVHELLNAAGRAGRAGHYAHGIVIDLPGKVFSVEANEGQASFDGLEHAMSLFGMPDQCLDVVDPVTQVLDRIAKEGAAADISQYFVRRTAGLEESALATILGRSLGNVRRGTDSEDVAAQVLILRRAAEALEPDEIDGYELEEWREMAALSGTSAAALAAVNHALPTVGEIVEWEFSELSQYTLGVLLDRPGMLFALVDPASSDLSRVLPPREDERIAEWEARVCEALREVVVEWQQGVPLGKLGDALHRHRQAGNHVKRIDLGRRFALNVVRGVAHGISLVCRVIERRISDAMSVESESLLRVLPGCVREGFDHPDKLLLFWHLRRMPGLYPRVIVHRAFGEIGRHLPHWHDVPDIDLRRAFVARVAADAGL